MTTPVTPAAARREPSRFERERARQDMPVRWRALPWPVRLAAVVYLIDGVTGVVAWFVPLFRGEGFDLNLLSLIPLGIGLGLLYLERFAWLGGLVWCWVPFGFLGNAALASLLAGPDAWITHPDDLHPLVLALGFGGVVLATVGYALLHFLPLLHRSVRPLFQGTPIERMHAIRALRGEAAAAKDGPPAASA